MKYETNAQVIEALKAYAEKAEKVATKARKTLRELDQPVSYNWRKPIHYRSIGGPFFKNACVFSTKRYFFDPIRMDATSYSWWSMLTVINGKIVWNKCGYSPQTSKHQDLLEKALKALKIKPDLVVYTRKNIGAENGLKSAYIEAWVESVMWFRHCRKANKEFARKRIRWTVKKLVQLETVLGFEFSEAELKAALEKAEERRARDLQRKRDKRSRAKERVSDVRESNGARAVVLAGPRKGPGLVLVKGGME